VPPALEKLAAPPMLVIVPVAANISSVPRVDWTPPPKLAPEPTISLS